MKRSPTAGALAALALASAAFPGCAPDSPAAPDSAERPDIVLIVVDTLRADHLPTYGYARATAPRLQELAAESVVFERAFTVMSHTLPAHVSLMSGLHPAEHGVLSNGWAFRGGPPLLAERLKAAGYDTAAFVSGFPLQGKLGLERGFDVYVDPVNAPSPLGPERVPGELTTQRALRWLQDRGSDPLFLWVHYFDVHADYVWPEGAPEPLAQDAGLARVLEDRGLADARMEDVMYGPIEVRGRPASLAEAVNAYDNQIRRVDALIGKLVDALDARDERETWLVITSDHGEGLGQHGYFGHDYALYEEQLRIPLLVRAPRGARIAPRRAEEIVSLLDVPLTLLGAAGAEADLRTSGRALPLAARGDAGDGRWLVARRRDYSERTQDRREGRFASREALWALRGDEPWKYLNAGSEGEELYDLSADPGEQHNLIVEEPERAARMRSTLSDALEDMVDEAATDVDTRVDDETREALEALGYLP